MKNLVNFIDSGSPIPEKYRKEGFSQKRNQPQPKKGYQSSKKIGRQKH